MCMDVVVPASINGPNSNKVGRNWSSSQDKYAHLYLARGILLWLNFGGTHLITFVYA